MTRVVKPHKWAREIKLWADGAVIQYRDLQAVHECDRYWFTLGSSQDRVDWDGRGEYREKPAPVYPKSTLTVDAAWSAYQSSRGIMNDGKAALKIADKAIEEFIVSGEAEKYFNRN